MRRWMAVLTAVAVSAPAVAVAGTGAFDDDDGTYYDLQPDNLLAAGITAGVDASNPRIYGGEQPVTRGQMAIFLSRLGGLGDNAPVADAETLQGMTPQEVAALGGGTAGQQGPEGPAGPPGAPGSPGAPGTQGPAGLLDAPGYSVTKVQSGDASQPAIAIGVDGFPLVAYRDVTTGALRVAHCQNVACTSLTATTLREPASVSGFLQPAIAVGPDGLAYITYLDDDSGFLSIDRCIDVACTGSTGSPIGPAAIGGPSLTGGPAMTIGADGLPVIAYTLSNLSDGIQIRHCTTYQCNSTTLATPDAGADVAEVALETGADGLVIAGYMDWASADLRAVKCTNLACSTFTAPAVVDGSVSGGGLGVTIGGDGFPFFGYLDAGLSIAHCSTLTCSGVSTVTPLDSPTTGPLVSATTGVAGLPLLASTDWGNGTLRLTHCAIAVCNVATAHPVLPASASGADPAVTIGVDGMPIVAFVDADGDVSIVHFANRFAVPNTREW